MLLGQYLFFKRDFPDCFTGCIGLFGNLSRFIIADFGYQCGNQGQTFFNVGRTGLPAGGNAGKAFLVKNGFMLQIGQEIVANGNIKDDSWA